VGEESKGKPLKSFIPQLLQFKRLCKAEGVDIPFLFHCGETLEIGGETDGNLYDALLLGAKRIGHGFALARHPYVMEQMKKNNVCLELCPISNEILGLTPRVGGHAMYTLLANNVHCTLNTDNGTLFRLVVESNDFRGIFLFILIRI
jgi:adenosine deaminase CECR1